MNKTYFYKRSKYYKQSFEQKFKGFAELLCDKVNSKDTEKDDFKEKRLKKLYD